MYEVYIIYQKTVPGHESNLLLIWCVIFDFKMSYVATSVVQTHINQLSQLRVKTTEFVQDVVSYRT